MWLMVCFFSVAFETSFSVLELQIGLPRLFVIFFFFIFTFLIFFFFLKATCT